MYDTEYGTLADFEHFLRRHMNGILRKIPHGTLRRRAILSYRDEVQRYVLMWAQMCHELRVEYKYDCIHPDDWDRGT